MISYERLFEKLKSVELSSYRLKKMKDPIIAQATLTRLKREEGGIDSNTLNRLCKYFDCQPGDLMEYVPDPATEWQTINIETSELSNTDFNL
ncbi:Cro/C1-type HTH DNA-binding domain protein [anaerobic digester metagenome]